jgi:hypothetical protein
MTAVVASLKSRYERHPVAYQLLAFACGFAFDAVAATGHGPDHPILIYQQVGYLLMVGAILYGELIREARPEPSRSTGVLARLWSYRELAVHFFLGTLMNLYSIFFLLSASFASSIVFVVILFGLIVLNELGSHRFGVDVKVGLFVICVFCFLSLVIPVWIGHVGTWPFVAAVAGTVVVTAAFYGLLRRRLSTADLRRRLLHPAIAVIVVFTSLNLVGFVPPVPIAAKRLAVYHNVERQGDDFVLSYQGSPWKFWLTSDEPFLAQPGDKVYLFTSIFSPAKFDDSVMIRWAHVVNGSWVDTDKLSLPFTGGHRGGYRAYTWKADCPPGDWRVTVETTTGIEIARLTFTVIGVPANPSRTFRQVRY